MLLSQASQFTLENQLIDKAKFLFLVVFSLTAFLGQLKLYSVTFAEP